MNYTRAMKSRIVISEFMDAPAVEMLAARFSLSEPAKASKAVLLLELEALLAARRRDADPVRARSAHL